MKFINFTTLCGDVVFVPVDNIGYISEDELAIKHNQDVYHITREEQTYIINQLKHLECPIGFKKGE